MRITKNILREYGIFNPHNLAKAGGAKLYINYATADYGRMSRSAQWEVVGIGFATAPNAPWYDYGHKTFTVLDRGEKQPKLQEVMEWCKETYGITEWEKDPFGGYQIKGTIAKALAPHH